jgi:hypothetical protein
VNNCKLLAFKNSLVIVFNLTILVSQLEKLKWPARKVSVQAIRLSAAESPLRCICTICCSWFHAVPRALHQLTLQRAEWVHGTRAGWPGHTG